MNIDALLAQLVMLIFYFAGNGMIDFNEFVVMMQKKKSSMTREGELREAFRMFDKVECKKISFEFVAKLKLVIGNSMLHLGHR